MSLSLNLSRRDAWSRVLQYVAVWLLFWLLLGLAGSLGILSSHSTRIDSIPMPPFLLDEQPALVDEPLVVRGRIKRSHTDNIGLARSGPEATDPSANSSTDPSTDPSTFVARVTGAAQSQTTAAFASDAGFFAQAPAGFADLLGVQNTQADIYFQDRLLISSFIEYDLEQVWLLAPEEVVDAIPTLKNPQKILAALTGPLDNNSHLLCNRRVRENCGELDPEIAGIIFDEGKFRVSLFINQSELAVQYFAGERYLPAPSAGWGTLHNLRFGATGQQGTNSFNLNGESFVSKDGGRARVRYGLTNNGGVLQEASWQWDDRDREFEAGVFRGVRGNSLFVNDKRILGLRLGSSTKTRTDLSNALATPIFVFLERRSRVDIIREGELLASSFYDAGNHQLDTTRLPDGAYDITVRTLTADGRTEEQQHFFVRNSLLPPVGEKRYYLEGGAFTDDFNANVPRTSGGGWLRGGLTSRVGENFALEGELLLSNQLNLVQTGAFLLGRGWQVHAGVLASDRGDKGYSLRGQLQRKNWSLVVNAQHLDSKTDELINDRFDSSLTSNMDFEVSNDLDSLDPDVLDRRQLTEREIVGGSYTQASASLGFPVEIPLWGGRSSKGRVLIRAQYSQRNNTLGETSIGLNYAAPLFRRNGLSAGWTFQSLYSDSRSLVQLGVDIRWRNGQQTSVLRPNLVASRSKDPFTDVYSALEFDPSINASWSRSHRSDLFGNLSEQLSVSHQSGSSVLGGRLASESSYGFSELNLAYTEGPRSGLQYSANSRFSLVSKGAETALGGGTNQLAAVVVEIDGDIPDADFKILIDNRVVGYASTNRRGVVSLRPYATYEVRVSPDGDAILGYDENRYEVTLYPGNVHRLVFAAREVRVLISQAVDEEGSPIAHAKFLNVDGYGATDLEGWFQVEVSHSDDLQLSRSDGSFCVISPPPPEPDEEGLTVLDALVCRTIPAPPSE